MRTITLLRYLSEPALREQITAITNRTEAFHGFADWLMFGGGDSGGVPPTCSRSSGLHGRSMHQRQRPGDDCDSTAVHHRVRCPLHLSGVDAVDDPHTVWGSVRDHDRSCGPGWSGEGDQARVGEVLQSRHLR
ncbi:Tn3 family transposase [Nonomuraea dietziae]|uniref:Tn3 family transposase n=1 Tax=Nonomuraea dietziae TaxID=65515 RepID=UPI0033CDC3D4